MVKQILLKVSSNISQITIERVEFFPPFPVARIKDLNRFFVSFKSTNQPHFHCTLYSNCIVYTVFTGPKNHFLLQTTAFSLSCWQSCHHPLGKAPAARDRLHKQQVTGSCLVESSQFAVSWKGRGQSGVATKPFCCIFPPVSVSCCP